MTTSGSNQGVVGVNFTTTDPPAKVIEFYAKELGIPAPTGGAGNLIGTKNGHKLTIIVTDAFEGKTAVSIIQPKSP